MGGSTKRARPAAVGDEAADLKGRIRDFATCPVCLYPMAPKIFQCENGHPVCEQCLDRLTICPTCRAGLANPSRNLPLEQIAADVEFECRFSECHEQVKHKALAAHYDMCRWRPFSCPECSWQGPLADWRGHCASEHEARSPVASSSALDIYHCYRESAGRYFRVFFFAEFGNEEFVLTYALRDSEYRFSCHHVAASLDPSYRWTLAVQGPDGITTQYVRECAAIRTHPDRVRFRGSVSTTLEALRACNLDGMAFESDVPRDVLAAASASQFVVKLSFEVTKDLPVAGAICGKTASVIVDAYSAREKLREEVFRGGGFRRPAPTLTRFLRFGRIDPVRDEEDHYHSLLADDDDDFVLSDDDGFVLSRLAEGRDRRVDG
ncbi:hypothetical protein CTAYLR_004461 [Chrysophaeum taylorii]|uniref:RING-type E3 ubiquitin transferase n=1 Tax=Chrysophaeum taylorii TaxID=2483200 RepID=A0AAD7XKX8_9STRA|nr:hypothetical protein CTAYLR_004461 [Chrysophaeum taylorii]